VLVRVRAAGLNGGDMMQLRGLYPAPPGYPQDIPGMELAGEVVALDETQARALRGPRADPAAFMLLRPYLKLAVYIEVIGEHQDRPYWLIGSRRPAELAAAIERSRPQARAGGTPVG